MNVSQLRQTLQFTMDRSALLLLFSLQVFLLIAAFRSADAAPLVPNYQRDQEYWNLVRNLQQQLS